MYMCARSLDLFRFGSLFEFRWIIFVERWDGRTFSMAVYHFDNGIKHNEKSMSILISLLLLQLHTPIFLLSLSTIFFFSSRSLSLCNFFLFSVPFVSILFIYFVGWFVLRRPSFLLNFSSKWQLSMRPQLFAIRSNRAKIYFSQIYWENFCFVVHTKHFLHSSIFYDFVLRII